MCKISCFCFQLSFGYFCSLFRFFSSLHGYEIKVVVCFPGHVYRSHLPIVRIRQRELKPNSTGPDASCCWHRTLTYCYSDRVRYAVYPFIWYIPQAICHVYGILVDYFWNLIWKVLITCSRTHPGLDGHILD